MCWYEDFITFRHNQASQFFQFPVFMLSKAKQLLLATSSLYNYKVRYLLHLFLYKINVISLFPKMSNCFFGYYDLFCFCVNNSALFPRVLKSNPRHFPPNLTEQYIVLNTVKIHKVMFPTITVGMFYRCQNVTHSFLLKQYEIFQLIWTPTPIQTILWCLLSACIF